MRKLNEQWIDGGRMYKAVPSVDVCDGCCYLDISVYPHERTCGECKTGTDELIVKDLGPVNEDGCLAEERSGLFPEIKHQRYVPVRWSCLVMDDFGYVRTFGDTKQEAIDAWNRRHA